MKYAEKEARSEAIASARGQVSHFLIEIFPPGAFRQGPHKRRSTHLHARVASAGISIYPQIVIPASHRHDSFKPIGARKKGFPVSKIAADTHVRITQAGQSEILYTGKQRFKPDKRIEESRSFHVR